MVAACFAVADAGAATFHCCVGMDKEICLLTTAISQPALSVVRCAVGWLLLVDCWLGLCTSERQCAVH